MSIKYLNIYNNLIKLTTNKRLYQGLTNQDTFEDRLVLFLIHFAFFLNVYNKKEDKKTLQKIYDLNFRHLELSIREIGYGDQSINNPTTTYGLDKSKVTTIPSNLEPASLEKCFISSV